MPHSVRSAFPSLRALLLVVMGLSWNGLASDLYARCGGLPRGWSHEAASHGSTAARNRSVPSPLPSQPRCSGPSCSEAPLPAAPIVIAARGGERLPDDRSHGASGAERTGPDSDRRSAGPTSRTRGGPPSPPLLLSTRRGKGICADGLQAVPVGFLRAPGPVRSSVTAPDGTSPEGCPASLHAARSGPTPPHERCAPEVIRVLRAVATCSPFEIPEANPS